MSADPYAVLEVGPEASPDEIKRAYRRLARQWHPDRNAAPEAEARFKEVSAAYELLMDPRRRAMHDRVTLGTAGGASAVPMTFLQDFTDAVERAEWLVLQWMMAHYMRRYGRGRGAELAAHLARDLVDGTAFTTREDPGWWARWRARRRLSRLSVLIDYQRWGPASQISVWNKRWRIILSPNTFWEQRIREPPELDDEVARHVAAQVLVFLANEAGVRWLLMRHASGDQTVGQARALDDEFLRRRWLVVALWLGVGALSVAMLWSGFASRY